MQLTMTRLGTFCVGASNELSFNVLNRFEKSSESRSSSSIMEDEYACKNTDCQKARLTIRLIQRSS
jgi:hypothetical protein